MANRKISDFAVGGALQVGDKIPIARGSDNYHITGWGTCAQQMSNAIAVTGGTMSGVTITNCRYNQLYDTTGDLALIITHVASPTSYLTLTNSSTDLPGFTATSSTTNTGIRLTAKGTGSINLQPGATTNYAAVLWNGAGTYSCTLNTSSLVSSTILSLPAGSGTLIVDPGVNGFMVRNGVGTTINRSITAATGLAVVNGDGAAGNPSVGFDLPSMAAEASPDTALDALLLYDTSTLTHKKVIPDVLADSNKDNMFKVRDNVDNTKALAFECSSISTATTRTLTVPNQSGVIALIADLAALPDNTTNIVDNADATKKLAFECSGITTGTTRTMTVPNQSGTLAVVSDIPVVATQADQETATSTTTFVSPGRQQYHPSAAKVWGTAGLTGNLLEGYNVASITDTGTGVATLAYTTAFSSSTHAVVATPVGGVAQMIVSSAAATTGVVLTCYGDTGVAADPTQYKFAMFGDQ